jgi:small subunit ribosomal protein S10
MSTVRQFSNLLHFFFVALAKLFHDEVFSNHFQVSGYLQTVTKVVLCRGVMAAKIRVVMKSFASQSNKVSGLLPYTKKVGLPESRALFTVLRSPHIDKKSREQFSMHVKKQFVEQKAEIHELHKKLFWLKRLRIPGAQYEVQISFKTRLDKGSLKSLAA